MKKGVVKWRTVWGRKKKSKERRKGAERFSVAELLNCPFSKAPQPQNLSRGNPQGHRRIRDGEREKTRDERSASLNRLEENIVTLISPSLILTPNVVMAASSSGTTAPLETSDTYRALYFLTGLGLKSKVEGDFKAVGEVFFLS
ncbi:hypothetical protein Q8A67_000709 [Cirrhinus molitorella]|uniref:Uncharacterized protein n=1 Tax=Cirrhinus molitorella TaxID=172907 RepID=A0AA88QGF1_9TELE|nr:hypothetical protein Q8A67_000709 [Cirrhinus molitorella]